MNPSNRRLSKAVVAGGLGLLLLTGIGGTFAYWYEAEAIGSGNLTAGHLDMTVTGGQWVDVNNDRAVIDPASFRMVPGDVVEYTATVTPDLVGDNLEAELVADFAGATGALVEFVEIGSSINGAPTQLLTPASSGTPIAAAVRVSMPWGADTVTYPDGGEDASLDLSSMTITLTQTENP